jgi:hypothetical protein
MEYASKASVLRLSVDVAHPIRGGAVSGIQLAGFLNGRRKNRSEVDECLFRLAFQAGDCTQHVMQSPGQSVIFVLGDPAQLEFDVVLCLVPQSSVPGRDDRAGELVVQSGFGDDFLV